MYLKSIEVHGFKSFANKLVFEFHNGITGIVGPNGSGKSNVADAVRWVLGEQSAKQLRGASMQDVIFSGTELRKPQGYAYVALTISNEDHKLNVPYEEVQVARRVYRSGESEYLLNGTSCRLRDVQELFFDTGIGKEGYSIIGQGQIDKILSGKPEDRRELFDEAAGIVKYKKRKRTAEKNLEAERANLTRVQDILSELEKQVGPLERQSEKAKEYLKLKQDLKEYEINLFLVDYENNKEEVQEVEKNMKNITAEIEQAKQEKESEKTKYSEVENQVEEFNKSIEENKNKVNEDKLKLGQIENEIKLTQQKIQNTKDGKEFHDKRLAEVVEQLNKVKKEQEDSEKQRNKMDEKLKAVVEKETEKKESLETAVKRIREIDSELTKRNSDIFTFNEDHTKISSEQQKYESMLEQNSIKKADITRLVLENQTEVAAAKETMEAEKTVLEEKREQLEDHKKEKQGLVNELTQALAAQRELEFDLEKTNKNYHLENSRLESLRNMTERYDGYGQSIRRIMEQKNHKKGIIGVVADIIKVDKEYETAIETSLGGNIQNIVTEDEHIAKEMIRFIKKNRYGRATFLPLTTVRPKPDKLKEAIFEEKGVIGTASSLVHADKKFNNVIEFLLGRFLVVDTIDNAMALGKKYNYTVRAVTLEGELLAPGGSLSGGAFKNASNLLGRRHEMEELEDKIKKLRKEVDDCKKDMEEQKTTIQKLRSDISKKDERLKELELAENTAKIKYDQAVATKEQKELEYWNIASDLKELDRQKDVLEETLERIRKQLSESKEKTDANMKEIDELKKEQEKLRKDEHKLQEEVSELSVQANGFLKELEFAKDNLARLNESMESLTKDVEELKLSHSESDNKVEEYERIILALKDKIDETKTEVKELTVQVEKDTKDGEELMSKQKDFFEHNDKITEHISHLEKENFRLDARKSSLEGQITNQVNYMWNEYEVTYIGAREYKMEESISYPKMKSIVTETKSKIRSLGDVNVNAIEDYKNVFNRYEELKKQHDDLVQSEEVLLKIIEDLDEEMRKQFTEKFAEIRVQFDKVFKELFGGGKGTLELVEEEDVLESGIKIIAQPPGKKLQNMMQLSGGEKALTAISLLFAIQNLKPSPFCLLDEIEAALDDSNVKRYAKYLHKLTKNTQFIVITHRQGTMAAADALYGITMQEKGVSTLVSVKLIEEQLKNEEKNKKK